MKAVYTTQTLCLANEASDLCSLPVVSHASPEKPGLHRHSRVTRRQVPLPLHSTLLVLVGHLVSTEKDNPVDTNNSSSKNVSQSCSCTGLFKILPVTSHAGPKNPSLQTQISAARLQVPCPLHSTPALSEGHRTGQQ